MIISFGRDLKTLQKSKCEDIGGPKMHSPERTRNYTSQELDIRDPVTLLPFRS